MAAGLLSKVFDRLLRRSKLRRPLQSLIFIAPLLAIYRRER